MALLDALAEALQLAQGADTSLRMTRVIRMGSTTTRASPIRPAR
jgi:hypothetical protein